MLSQAHVGAMQVSRREGRILAKQHPEIADEYRQGATYCTLADKYLLHISSKNIRENAVGYAVRELISKEELRAINGPRHKERGRKLGTTCKKNHVGIFGMTKEEKIAAGKSAMKKLLDAVGKKSWNGLKKPTEFGLMTEGEYVTKLVLLETCGYKLITKLVNLIFGNGRTYWAVKKQGGVIRHQKKNK